MCGDWEGRLGQHWEMCLHPGSRCLESQTQETFLWFNKKKKKNFNGDTVTNVMPRLTILPMVVKVQAEMLGTAFMDVTLVFAFRTFMF